MRQVIQARQQTKKLIARLRQMIQVRQQTKKKNNNNKANERSDPSETIVTLPCGDLGLDGREGGPGRLITTQPVTTLSGAFAGLRQSGNTGRHSFGSGDGGDFQFLTTPYHATPHIPQTLIHATLGLRISLIMYSV